MTAPDSKRTHAPSAQTIAAVVGILATLVVGAIGYGALVKQVDDLQDDVTALTRSVERLSDGRANNDKRITAVETQQANDSAARKLETEEMRRLRTNMETLTRNIDALCIATRARCIAGERD